MFKTAENDNNSDRESVRRTKNEEQEPHLPEK